MKKICFFVGDMNLSGGTERVSSVIINQLSQAGFEVHVVNLSGGDKPFFPLDSAVICSSLDGARGGRVKMFYNSVIGLRRYLKRNAIDRLIAVESILALFAVPATRLLGLQLIIWEHFNFHVDLGRRSRRVARHLAAVCGNHIVTLTERDKMFWQKESWCRAKVTAIANPVPFDVSEHQAEPSSKVFLAAGRLTYQKGFDLLLEAWKPVSVKHTDWTLKIVGSGEDHQMLVTQAERLEIQESVKFFSVTSEIEHHYKSATYYVMSSRFEGLPMVLLEALSFGLPIVSFDCDTGPADIITPGRNGWLCHPGSVAALTQGMLDGIAVANLPDTYLAYSAQAKIKSGDFSLDAIKNKWIAVLDDANP